MHLRAISNASTPSRCTAPRWFFSSAAHACSCPSPNKGANLQFPKAKILDNFAYEFDRGDRIGIVGGNGVGKTTFLNVLMGAQPLDSGEVKTGATVR